MKKSLLYSIIFMITLAPIGMRTANAVIGLKSASPLMTIAGASTLGTMFAANTAGCFMTDQDVGIYNLMCVFIPTAGITGYLNTHLDVRDPGLIFPVSTGLQAALIATGIVLLDKNGPVQISLPEFSDEKINGMTDAESMAYSNDRELLQAYLNDQMDQIYDNQKNNVSVQIGKFGTIDESSFDRLGISKEALTGAMKVIKNKLSL